MVLEHLSAQAALMINRAGQASDTVDIAAIVGVARERLLYPAPIALYEPVGGPS